MLVAIYTVFKAPKAAGVMYLILGLVFAAVGVWGVIVQPGVFPWVLFGAGALMAATGWLLLGGIK
jgi:hypothetical protein